MTENGLLLDTLEEHEIPIPDGVVLSFSFQGAPANDSGEQDSGVSAPPQREHSHHKRRNRMRSANDNSNSNDFSNSARDRNRRRLYSSSGQSDQSSRAPKRKFRMHSSASKDSPPKKRKKLASKKRGGGDFQALAKARSESAEF